jgi:hypothetical protein
VPDEISSDDFKHSFNVYRSQAFGQRGRLDGLGLQGLPFPDCAPAVIRCIQDPLGRLDAWIDLANFCADSGAQGQRAACALEAEALLPSIEKQNLRATRILRLIQHLWLPFDGRGKALEHCRAMAMTEARIRALLLVVDHDRRSGDAESSAEVLSEAEANARVCSSPENGFESCLEIGRWKRHAEDPAGARAWFEEARALLRLIRKPGMKAEKLDKAWASLSESLPAPWDAGARSGPLPQTGRASCPEVRRWARSAPNPPGVGCGFERAGHCLVPPKPGDHPVLSEEELLGRLERIYPDPKSIIDRVPPPPKGPCRPGPCGSDDDEGSPAVT